MDDYGGGEEIQREKERLLKLFHDGLNKRGKGALPVTEESSPLVILWGLAKDFSGFVNDQEGASAPFVAITQWWFDIRKYFSGLRIDGDGIAVHAKLFNGELKHFTHSISSSIKVKVVHEDYTQIIDYTPISTGTLWFNRKHKNQHGLKIKYKNGKYGYFKKMASKEFKVRTRNYEFLKKFPEWSANLTSSVNLISSLVSVYAFFQKKELYPEDWARLVQNCSNGALAMSGLNKTFWIDKLKNAGLRGKISFELFGKAFQAVACASETVLILNAMRRSFRHGQYFTAAYEGVKLLNAAGSTGYWSYLFVKSLITKSTLNPAKLFVRAQVIIFIVTLVIDYIVAKMKAGTENFYTAMIEGLKTLSNKSEMVYTYQESNISALLHLDENSMIKLYPSIVFEICRIFAVEPIKIKEEVKRIEDSKFEFEPLIPEYSIFQLVEMGWDESTLQNLMKDGGFFLIDINENDEEVKRKVSSLFSKWNKILDKERTDTFSDDDPDYKELDRMRRLIGVYNGVLTEISEYKLDYIGEIEQKIIIT